MLHKSSQIAINSMILNSFSTATAAAFVRYLTFTGTARRWGSFHY